MRNCDVAEGEVVRIIDTGKMYSGKWIDEELYQMFPDIELKGYLFGPVTWYDDGILEPDELFIVHAVGHLPTHGKEVALIQGIETPYFYVISTEGIESEIITDVEFDVGELF